MRDRLVDALRAALYYASVHNWPVHPVGIDKKPLTQHGKNDATIDEAQIREWWSQRPDALISVRTGAESGLAAVDVDIDPSAGFSGLDTLAEIGGRVEHTPVAHTPRGGLHQIFRHPGGFLKTTNGVLGRHLDIKGDGGSLILPPGPGRRWDPHLKPGKVELAPFPTWAIVREAESTPAPRTVAPAPRLTKYGEAALRAAAERIVAAGRGEQETVLNREAFAIGGLVAGNVVPMGAAEAALNCAAAQLVSFDRARPWRAKDLERKIRDALVAGMSHPRRPSNVH